MRSAILALLSAAGCFGQHAYIDIHIHWNERADFVPKLVEMYTKHNALACVSVRPKHFAALHEAAKKHPSIISPILWIDLDDGTVLADIDKAHAAGFRGVKIHSPEKNYDDVSYFPVFARLEVVIDRHNKLFDACQVPAEVRKKVFQSTASRQLRITQ